MPIQPKKKMCFNVLVAGHSDFLQSSFSKRSNSGKKDIYKFLFVTCFYNEGEEDLDFNPLYV